MLLLIVKVSPMTANIPTPVVRVPQPTANVPSPVVKMSVILQRRGQKRLSLRDVLKTEAIDLDVWIFMPAPQWALTVVVWQ
jgi:hypothetical protein